MAKPEPKKKKQPKSEPGPPWPAVTGEIDFRGCFDDAVARRERAYREANARWPLFYVEEEPDGL
jgi:hypothetical protein